MKQRIVNLHNPCLRCSCWLAGDGRLSVTNKARLQACRVNLAILAEGNGKDPSNVWGGLENGGKTEHMQNHGI